MVNTDGENKKVIGIIVECNPFHKGHARLIKECKKHGDFIIAVMSGNFVQRGEPAVYDKYKRTKDLLKHGVDLVVELPTEYVLSSAKYFASAGVMILDSLGFVDSLYFGSKIADIDELKRLANINIDGGSYSLFVQKFLKEGKAYAAAVGEVLGVNLSSNDILAIEYIRALKELNSSIVPVTIERKKDLPTASSLREKIKKKITCNDFSDILNYKLLLAKQIDTKQSFLNDIYLVTNDMKNSILKLKNKYMTFEEIGKTLHTKNRTLASIKRILFNVIFDIKKSDVILQNGSLIGIHPTCSYVRILGVKKESLAILKKIEVPILTSFAPKSYQNFIKKYEGARDIIYKNKKGEIVLSPTLQNNVFASNLYYLLSGDKKSEAEKELVIV